MPREFVHGWSPSLPDYRDLVFSVSPQAIMALPPSVDLSPNLPEPWRTPFNQGALGSCGPQSAAADLVWSALRQQGLSSCPMPSRLFIYYTTRMLMNTVNSDSGVYNRTLMRALAQYGWCDESIWPYDVSKFTTRPPQICFEQAASRKITQYLAVPQDLDQMRACLAQGVSGVGDPFIFGFTVYSSMLTVEVERTGIIPMPKRTDSVKGGHDVVIVGYDDATRQFKVRNSWDDWGVGGYGFIPYEYAASASLSGDFWTLRGAGLPVPIPTPTPTPAPGKRVITVTGDAKIEVDGVTV